MMTAKNKKRKKSTKKLQRNKRETPKDQKPELGDKYDENIPTPTFRVD